MKYLIVNADDFGASRGINRGIADAHRLGILTSTSLMVDAPRAAEAAELRAELPELGVGLHAVFTSEDARALMNLSDARRCRDELLRQVDRFEMLVGCAPTHLDSHHNIHRDPRLLRVFLAAARERGLPLREHCAARYFSNFYGQWENGETHLEQVSVEHFSHILQTELRTDVTELGCHPGYADPEFVSSYAVEREAELRTLCDPAVRLMVRESNVRLIHFGELREVAAGTANRRAAVL